MSFQDFITVINDCLKENDMEKLSKFRDVMSTRFTTVEIAKIRKDERERKREREREM